MRFASKSAIESENSAKAGSSTSKGKAEEAPPPGVKVWLSRNDVRELGRSGVVGLEGGRLREAERLTVLLSIITERSVKRWDSVRPWAGQRSLGLKIASVLKLPDLCKKEGVYLLGKREGVLAVRQKVKYKVGTYCTRRRHQAPMCRRQIS